MSDYQRRENTNKQEWMGYIKKYIALKRCSKRVSILKKHFKVAVPPTTLAALRSATDPVAMTIRKRKSCF